MSRPLTAVLTCLVVLLAGARSVWSGLEPTDRFFPPDSNVVNVRDFGAVGDGRTDDTAAIQRALDATAGGNRIIFLPRGIYLISDTLRWGEGKHPDGSWNEGNSWKNQILEGANRSHTIIRLAPDAPGFNDPESVKAMIWTGPKPAQRFRNAVRNLTIDTGDNRGAVGLQFNTSNQGTVREVNIVGNGAIGLDMAFTSEIGPLLVKDVRIEGHAVGILCGGSDVNSMTLEDVTLIGQRQVALRNEGQCVTVHRLITRDAPVAVHNRPGAGLMSLIDCDFQTPASEQPAVINEATMFARDIRTGGFDRAIRSSAPNGGGVLGASVDEWVSHPPLRTTDAPPRSLRLPVVDTPEVPWDPSDEWVSPQAFGAVINDGQCDVRAIQQAIDSGKSTLYFPAGVYNLAEPVIVRGNIRRIIGTEAIVEILRPLLDQPVGAFRIEDGTGEPLVFERIQGNPWNEALFRWFDHASRRDLIIRHCTFYVGHSYMNSVEGGRVFIEDVSNQTPGSGFWVFKGQTVYARQWNVENIGTNITNDRGTMWILGYKTERSGTLIHTIGGRTELLGGLCYSLHYEKPEPMFLNVDSDVSITIGEAVYDWGTAFGTLVGERASDRRFVLRQSDAYPRAGGSVIPLYRSSNHPAGGGGQPAQPHEVGQVELLPINHRELAMTWAVVENAREYRVQPTNPPGPTIVTVMPQVIVSGLEELTEYEFELVAVGASGVVSPATTIRAATAADTTPLQLLDARGLRHPDRVELRFSKPLDPQSARDLSNFTLIGSGIGSVAVGGDGQTVELHLQTPWADRPLEGRVVGLLDRASRPNRIDAPIGFRVAPPPPDQTLFELDLGTVPVGRTPDGVMDNSDWNGGRVDATVAAGPDRSRRLRLDVHQFGQVVLGRIPVEAGARYVVSADLTGGQRGQLVLLQVRQWDFPHTILGQGDFVVAGEGVQHLNFTFRAPEGGAHVPLFFITHQSGRFELNRVRVARVNE